MTKKPQKDSKIRPATPDKIELAATLLGQGALIAIPTDTVYGLAADALDKYAVARIFAIKGRPPAKPLVILCSDLLTARKLAPFSPLAHQLAEEFWPGALTLVVPRFPNCPLPAIVTAGFDSLALRVPRNTVAQALLKRAHGPVAVTSANRSGAPNPVTAEEVSEALRDDVDLILDGGRSDIGEVSTVLDVRGEAPVILRKGAVTRTQLEAFLGTPVRVAGE